MSVQLHANEAIQEEISVFQVTTEVLLKPQVFWNRALCRVDSTQHFRGLCRLHLQGKAV
jgi:hypothetical protein